MVWWESISSGSPDIPAHILYGDSFLLSRALKDLEAQVGSPEVLEANSHQIAGPETNLTHLRSFCDAIPFLAEHRLVKVEGLLKLFESREGRRRPASRRSRKAVAESSALSGWDDLPNYVENEMPSSTLLVFVDEQLSKGNALLTQLKPVSQVQEMPTPSREALSRWVRNRATDKGARISPGALSMLIQFVGGNLWTLDNELEKLALYASDRVINEGDVRLLASQSKEASIFIAVDALLEGRSSTALKTIQRLRNEGAEFPYIATMIGRQLRLVTLARDLIDRGHKEQTIGERLGIAHDFAVKRTVEQARKHSWKSLKTLYEGLLQADLAVKQGQLDQDLALELLVTDLGNIQQPQRAAR